MYVTRQGYLKWLLFSVILMLLVTNLFLKFYPLKYWNKQHVGKRTFKSQSHIMETILDQKIIELESKLRDDFRKDLKDMFAETHDRNVTDKPPLSTHKLVTPSVQQGMSSRSDGMVKSLPLVLDADQNNMADVAGTRLDTNVTSDITKQRNITEQKNLNNYVGGYAAASEEVSYGEKNETKYSHFTVIGKYKFHNRAEPTNYPPPKFPGFKIANKDLCKNNPTDYVIYVHTAADHIQNRQVIRRTWGNKDLFKDRRTKIVFFLGLNNHEALQNKLEKEALQYGDLVQGNFLDSYKNLTYKAILAVRWFKEYCTNVKLIIKTDDDIFLNIFQLMTLLESSKDVHRQVVCPIWQEGTMPILRDPKTCMKWCVQDNEYPGLSGYPRYCSGWTYIYSRDIVEDLAVGISHTPFHWIDDAWLTGAVLNKLLEINWVDILQYMDGNWQEVYKDYQDKNKPLKTMITHVGAKEMPLLWNTVVSRLTFAERDNFNSKVLSYYDSSG